MHKLLLTAFIIPAFAAAPLALAQADVSYVAPNGAQEPAPSENEDALNYFAADAKHKKERAEAIAQNPPPEGMVPASELDTLPTSVTLDGKAKLTVEGGKVVTQTKNAPAPVPASAPAATDNASGEAPKTLDAQLEAKQGTQQAIPANHGPESLEHISNNGGANVENTPVVDRQRGSKTNIISNTDTGVKLGQ